MFSFGSLTVAQKIIIGVISLAIVTVAAALIMAWVLAPERMIERQITDLTNNYYREYFYPEIEKNASDLETTMKKYEETGFTEVSLLQLMAEDSDGEFEKLLEYCDEDDTTVVFYPVAPYGEGDYKVEYRYSCSF